MQKIESGVKKWEQSSAPEETGYWPQALALGGFIGDGDAAETASGVEVDGVFAFFAVGLAVVGDAAKNKAGAGFDDDVFGDSDVNAAKECEGLDNGVFGESSMGEVEVDPAKDGDEVGAGEGFVFVRAFATGEDGHLGVETFAVAGFFDFLFNFFVVVTVEDGS